MSSKKIAKKLSAFQLALTNAKDPEILSATEAFNYDEDKIAEGEVLLNYAQQLNIKQEKEYGEQYTATDTLTKAIKEFTKTIYKPHLNLARNLFSSNPGIQAAMALNGPRKSSFEEWSNQVSLFYNNALSTPEIGEKFEELNLEGETFQMCLDKLNGLNLMRAAQKKESGEAQQATDDRDKAFDQISEWMDLYYTVAKIALADKPQLMEKLGIKA
jgi:hypothetical protein